MQNVNHIVTKATAIVAVGMSLLGMSMLAHAAPKKAFVNVRTGMCLDSNAEGKGYTHRCNGGNFQYWYLDGKRQINLATGRCLDSNAAGHVYTLPCNGGNFQNWHLSNQRLINAATGRCLDSNADGKLYTLPCNGGPFQNWR